MAKRLSNNFRVTPWSGRQHPTLSTVVTLLKQQNYRPYHWENTANYRYPVRTHNYRKMFYVIEGSVDVSFPDDNAVIRLRPGDRIEIAPNVRHSIQVGMNGVRCVEVALPR